MVPEPGAWHRIEPLRGRMPPALDEDRKTVKNWEPQVFRQRKKKEEE
jgi:hypothetical protein